MLMNSIRVHKIFFTILNSANFPDTSSLIPSQDKDQLVDVRVEMIGVESFDASELAVYRLDANSDWFEWRVVRDVVLVVLIML